MSSLRLVKKEPRGHLCPPFARKIELDTGIESEQCEDIALEITYGFYVEDRWLGMFSTTPKFCPFCGDSL